MAAKSATQIVAAARTAFEKASSVHYQGTIVQKGQKIGISINAGSKVGGGSVTLGGATADVRTIGTVDYLKAGTTFFVRAAHVPTAEASLVAGKWIEVPSTVSGFSEFSKLTNVHQVFSAAMSSKGQHFVKSGIATIAGKKVVAVKDAKGSTLYVDTTGTPYPVRISKGSTGSITFSRWDRKLHVSAPSNPLNLSSLAG